MLKAIWDFLMPRQRVLCHVFAFPRQAWPWDAAPPRILFTHGIMLEDDDYNTDEEEPDSATPSEPPVPDREPDKKSDSSSIIGIVAGLILLVLVIIVLTL